MAQENNMPRHVAIIMDGNGRWAEEKRLPRVAGHHEGTKRVKEIVKTARELGLGVITFFAFSAKAKVNTPNPGPTSTTTSFLVTSAAMTIVSITSASNK